MEVIPVKLAEALDTLKRKQLERRPVRVHEGVIARLETCERKRDSSRGSGLQYLLHNLNHHCHYLSPDKLLEALRILSDNQLFDRRTLYNLYDTIAKNLPYFTSTQHRSLLDSISKCINYTVKGTKLLSEEECTSIASQLDTIMCPPPKSETANDIFTKENGNSCAVFDNSDTTETAISSVPDTCRDDPLSIGDFDGGPVPLSELNRLQYDIVSKISTIYSKDDLINYGNATSLDALAILGSSLETMIRLSLSVDIDPTTVLECTKNLSNTMDTMQRLCFYDYTAISYGMGNLLRHAKSVADALSLLILGKLPTIIRAVPTLKYDVPNLETTSMFLKLDLLRHVREVQAAYVSGDITLFRMIADAFSQRLALFSPTDSSWLSLPTQQFINDIIRIEGHLRQFCKFLILRPRDCHNNIMRLCYKHQALHKILTLFDDHGQLRHRPDQTTHFLDLRPQELLAFISSYKDHLNTIDSKTACLLLSMVADSYRGLSKQDEGMVRELLPLFFNKVYNNCSALTASDVLYVVEKCYTNFGYLHHHAARVMLNAALSRYVINRMDAVLAANLHLICLSIPYNLVTGIDAKSFNRTMAYVNYADLGETCLTTNLATVTDPNAAYATFDTPYPPTAVPQLGSTVLPEQQRRTRMLDSSSGRNRCLCSTYTPTLPKQRPLQHREGGTPITSRKTAQTYLHLLWKAMQPERLRKVMALVH